MGETDARRHAVSQELSAPVLAELETWMKAERAKLSRRAQGYCPRPQVVAVRRLRPRWQALRGHSHVDRHRQAQRRRSASLARRCSRPDCGDPAEPARRTPSLELGSGAEVRSSRISRPTPQTNPPQNALAAQSRPTYPCGLQRMHTLIPPKHKHRRRGRTVEARGRETLLAKANTGDFGACRGITSSRRTLNACWLLRRPSA